MRYVFMIDIYISLLRAKTRELQIAASRLIRFVIRDSNSPGRSPDFQVREYIASTLTRHNEKSTRGTQYLTVSKITSDIGLVAIVSLSRRTIPISNLTLISQ